VRLICEGFPNEYWVKLDHEGAYPTEFVRALTETGYLAALIPKESEVGSSVSEDPTRSRARRPVNVLGLRFT
jgi:hypothetical protein